VPPPGAVSGAALACAQLSPGLPRPQQPRRGLRAADQCAGGPALGPGRTQKLPPGWSLRLRGSTRAPCSEVWVVLRRPLGTGWALWGRVQGLQGPLASKRAHGGPLVCAGEGHLPRAHAAGLGHQRVTVRPDEPALQHRHTVQDPDGNQAPSPTWEPDPITPHGSQTPSHTW